MAGRSTKYGVDIDYNLGGNANRGFGTLAMSAKKAHNEVAKLRKEIERRSLTAAKVLERSNRRQAVEDNRILASYQRREKLVNRDSKRMFDQQTQSAAKLRKEVEKTTAAQMRLRQDALKTSGSSGSGIFGTALAAAGGLAIFGKAKDTFIDFNSEMEQLRIGMTAVMQMQLKMPFEQAKDEAQKLFVTFQELAKKSPATTKDFMEMGAAIAPMIAMMGGGPDKLAKMAQGGVLASQAFGERADIVALDMKQMMMGTINAKDRIATQLVSSRGMSNADFNKLDSGKRAKLTEELFRDPALLKAADEMGNSFAGQASTFKDQLQIALGTVGLPLMQQMTTEFKKINTWIEKHPKTIKEWVTSFSQVLSKGFEYLKGVGTFFVENRDLLMGIAKTFAVFKGAQLAGSMFTRMAAGVTKFTDSMAASAANVRGSGLVTGLGGITGIAAGLTTRVLPALALFSGALDLASKFLIENYDAQKKARDSAIDLNEATGDYPSMRSRAKSLRNSLEGPMAFSNRVDPSLALRQKTELDSIEAQLYSPERLGLALRKISEASVKHGGVNLANLSNEEFMNSQIANWVTPHLRTFSTDKAEMDKNFQVLSQVGEVFKVIQSIGPMKNGGMLDEILKSAFPEQYGMPTPTETPAPSEDWKGINTKDINLTIQKVEVASEDPDRFVYGLVNMSENAIRHATQSQHTLAGGF